MVKSALHVHTTYSDGELGLEAVRGVFADAGCSVVCVADHAEAFTAESVAAYVEECASLSDERLRIIPGLEFGCRGRMHIVGYGVTERTTATDPETVIRHIRAAGGVAVIAHPKLEHFPLIEVMDPAPDGIEVWNSKYDGRLAPRPETFRLLHRVRVRQPGTLAFYGIDLHWRHQFRGLLVELDCADTSRSSVLGALSRGSFRATKGELILPSSGDVAEAQLVVFGRVNARSARLRRAVRTVKRHLGAVGNHLPTPITAQLRRLF